ncbi:hypothetical protein GGTG_09994 [Gaeumannomyces tritici R3-111a-1]|uniref:Uncharacterized protein n=1 Tax=Gaeumannomyces tritici (strain R3-111a-1) TaxID=644352 RepID=J3P910_GAET3|nr:hypothetical protein GGTG_09994 [Gaeumannomyces tritici R3-111a-1]EJT73145.1 hypothetical protein GGTG_09994 [Gaeumannomyces tritici R3-111a-1]
MQLINLAKLVALVAIATPLVAHPTDRSALEVRTTTGIRPFPVTINAIKRDEVAQAIEPIRIDLQQPARRSSDFMLAPRMDPFSIAALTTTGFKVLGSLAKGVKGWISEYKAKKAGKKTESEDTDEPASSDESASDASADDESSSSSSGGDESASESSASESSASDESSDESASESSASDESSDESSDETSASDKHKKRTVVVKRAAVWSA